MNQQKKSKASMRRLLPVALVAVLLLALYALAGFLLAPWIAQRELPRLVAQQLHQRARIAAISFNPFTLRLHARGFALETATGTPLFGFADAVADLEWRSLLRRAWILDEVRFDAPALNLEISKDGRLNLAALAPHTGGADPGPLPRFAIGHLAVTEGSIAFADRRQGYSNRLEHLSIKVSSLSTLGAEPGSYALQGRTPQGVQLRWKGALSLTPLAARGTLALDKVVLKQMMPYVDAYTAVRILSGEADLELPYELTLAQGKPRFSLKTAKLEVRELALGSAGKRALQARLGAISFAGVDFDSAAQQAAVQAVRVGATSLITGKDGRPLAKIGALALDGVKFGLSTRSGSADALAVAGAGVGSAGGAGPAAAVRQLALHGVAFDLGARRVSAKALRVADLRLALARDAKGKLDLLQLFAGAASSAGSPSGAAGAAKPAKWQASIASVEIGGASARYTDRTARTPLALSADGLSGRFTFEAASNAQGVRVHLGGGNLALARFQAGAATGPPALRLAGLSVEGMRYDSAENSLAADALRIGSLGVNTAIDKGRVALLDLLPATGPSNKSAKPLSAQLKAFELKDGVVSVADRGSGIALVLQRLRAKLTDVSTDSASPLAFDASADVKSGGHIALRGQAVPARGRVSAKIEAHGLALAPIQPLLARLASVKLDSGKAALSGTLRVGGKRARLAYSGSASITHLALDDLSGVRLFGWKSLATDSLKASLSPNRIDVDALQLTAPAGRFIIAKDGSSNLSRAFAGKHAAGGQGRANAAKTAAAPAPSTAAATAGKNNNFAVAVRRMRVDQGALDFSDDSLSPNFVAKIYELAGTANGLSSDRDTRSQFALEGRVGKFGYARLSGAVNPFAPRARSAFRVQLRNIDLATVTPYSMRFAGYRIAGGNMTLDLHYRVRDSLIEGDNNITLEQFRLGERVDSPEALKLPFELAVALLKDPDGTISLQVPVKGNLDDPHFSLAPLIWKAVGHLIGNIVAAPFRALAHLFGGGSEGQGGAIVFDPGRSRLLPPEREKIARIAAALAKRPELKLEIPARYDSEADARALKRAALEREIGRRAGYAPADDAAPERVNIEDKKTRAALRSLFAERFGKGELDKLRAEAEAQARAAKQPKPSVIERARNWASGEPQVVDPRAFYRTLLRRLREAQPLPPNALTVLANQRARAIEAALTAAGVDAARITRSVAQPTADARARQIKVQLSLAAR